MLMKNNIAALWILGSIASPIAMARNLRGGTTTGMNYPAELHPDSDTDVDKENRKLDSSYSYYWTQTGNSNRYFHGNFKQQDGPEGWVREDWTEAPPADAGWTEGSWGEDGPPGSWDSWDSSWSNSWDFGPDDRKLDSSYSYYWTQTENNNRYFHGNFKQQDGPEGWIRQDWTEGPPADAGWTEGSWGEDGPPGSWDSWDSSWSNSWDFGPDDRKLDSSYSYYWTQTGNTNRYFRGNFKQQDGPEGWVRQDWSEGPPANAGWIEGSWGEDGPPGSWDSWSYSEDSP